MSSLYLHIPFCRKRCTYCDFHFSTTFVKYREAMVSSLGQELFLRKNELSSPIETIYFGGGTPSLLNREELGFLMQQIRQNFKLSASCEITLEVNPEDITKLQLASWKDLGINRLSIGLQSIFDKDLSWMNRAHTTKDALIGVQMAQQEGFDNISVDLIYGLPDQSSKEWLASLDKIFSLGIQHLSAYCLTVEPKTALNHLVRQKKLIPADEPLQSEQFRDLINKAQLNGFEQYEISNFSLPGFNSRHNSAYWQFTPYLGIGPSAHSFNGKTRRWNVRNNTSYIKNLNKNNFWYDEENLSPNELRNEQILLGLRTKWGLNLVNFDARWTKNEREQIEEFKDNHWLEESKTCISLTDKGKLHADGIAAALFRLD